MWVVDFPEQEASRLVSTQLITIECYRVLMAFPERRALQVTMIYVRRRHTVLGKDGDMGAVGARGPVRIESFQEPTVNFELILDLSRDSN